MLSRRLHLPLQDHLLPEGQQVLVLSKDDTGKKENFERARFVPGVIFRLPNYKQPILFCSHQQ